MRFPIGRIRTTSDGVGAVLYLRTAAQSTTPAACPCLSQRTSSGSGRTVVGERNILRNGDLFNTSAHVTHSGGPVRSEASVALQAASDTIEQIHACFEGIYLSLRPIKVFIYSLDVYCKKLLFSELSVSRIHIVQLL